MPKSFPFELEKEFANADEFETYRQQTYDFCVSHQKVTNYCTICLREHKMRTQYAFCTNSECTEQGTRECPRKAKIYTCLSGHVPENEQVRQIHTIGQHLSDVIVKKNRAITSKVKQLIDMMMNEGESVKSKRIYTRLEREWKNYIDIMPTLAQVQCYVNGKKYKKNANQSLCLYSYRFISDAFKCLKKFKTNFNNFNKL